MPVNAPLPADTKEQAKALYLQGLQPVQIAQILPVSPVTLRKWTSRHGWTKLRDKADSLAVTPKRVTPERHFAIVQQAPAVASSRLRQRLQAEVESQLTVLEEKRAKGIRELGNTPDGEGRASVVKRLTDATALIDDWESQRTPGIVLMGEGIPAPEEQPAIDIQSVCQDEAAAALAALAED